MCWIPTVARRGALAPGLAAVRAAGTRLTVPARRAMDVLDILEEQEAAAAAWPGVVVAPCRCPVCGLSLGGYRREREARPASAAAAREADDRRVGTGLPARSRWIPGRGSAARSRFADAGRCVGQARRYAVSVPPCAGERLRKQRACRCCAGCGRLQCCLQRVRKS